MTWLTPETMLQLSIWLPVLGAAAIVTFGRWPNVREGIAIATGLVLLYLTSSLYSAFADGEIIEVLWLEPIPGLALKFRIEALGVLFSLVAAFLWPVTTIYSIGYMRAHHETNQTRFYACFAVSIASAMGVAFSGNLFTLFVFYEMLTLVTYPLVTHAGTDEAKKGGRVYIGMLLTTSIAFFLLAVIGTWVVAGTLDFRSGGIFHEDTSTTVLGILLALYVFGIGKAAVMPFHRWLPAAMVAPTPVSALLHAVAVVKAGVFTIMKVCVFIFGIDLLSILPATQVLLYIAGASVLLASLVAMRQDNLKARLAYSTVSQLGYVTTGALLGTSAGVVGGTMHIAMHAFGKITLFFCAGAILVAAHQTEISRMRGIGRQMPVTMAAFFIASLSIIGVPPGGGSWSKWFLITGTLEAGQLVLMGVLMLSTLLNIAYLLPIPIRAFFPGAEGHGSYTSVKEAPRSSLIAIGVTTVACVASFLFPGFIHELASAVLDTTGANNGP